MDAGPIALARSLLSASLSYWGQVHRRAVDEARGWRLRASAILDPTLRSAALAAHREKGSSLTAVCLFAAFAHTHARPSLVRAFVAFQTAFDFIDTVCESAADPGGAGRDLNLVLLEALRPSGVVSDHWVSYGKGDGGYLAELRDTVRGSLGALPRFERVAAHARRCAERLGDYQSLNHVLPGGSYQAFEAWGRSLPSSWGLDWWEAAAAGGSPIPVYALLTLASNPQLQHRDVTDVWALYVPWVAALSTLLDNLVDVEQDAAGMLHNLISYHPSQEDAASRLVFIASQAVERTRSIRGGHEHRMILAAMTGYFSSATANRCGVSRHGTRQVRGAVGGLATPAAMILSARRVAGGWTPGRSASPKDSAAAR